MAITSVNEIQDGRDGSQNIDGVCTYTRSFRVITSDVYDEAEQILHDGRLPMVGSPYPYNANAYLESRDISQDGQTKRFWTVTCKYTTKRNTPNGTQKNENPYFDPSEISWTTKKKQVPATTDAWGYPVVNSAGQEFQTPPEKEQVYLSCVYKRNVLAVSSAIFSLVDTINASAVIIDGIPFAAGYCLLDDISVGGWKVRNDIWYREVTINIVIESNDVRYPHTIELLDAGMQSYAILWDENGDPYDDGDLHDCVVWSTGAPAKTPQLLDGMGYQRLPGNNTPYWLYYQMHRSADWSGLRLV